MKVQLETITSQVNRSFSMMFNPHLSDLFFWHFHPEYELIYIEGATGTRHVGEHISTYNGSDLVLIGTNIPHLNFDYNVQSDYKKVVVHLKAEFVENHFDSTPELLEIKKLFEISKKGIAFSGMKKYAVGKRLFELEKLNPFQQFIQLIEILQLLTKIDEIELLHEKKYINKFSNRDQDRLHLIYAFVDSNYHRRIELDEMGKICCMTKEGFCRFFKKMTTYTFIEFLNRYRISHSKRYLIKGKSVSDACFQSGFESLSYYNRVFKKVTNETPGKFRQRYL